MNISIGIHKFSNITICTQCFINIYFDLCEIERRQLDMELKSIGEDHTASDDVYAASQTRLAKLSAQFFKETDRGLQQINMIKWNTYVFERLGIDNIAIFKPYGEKD